MSADILQHYWSGVESMAKESTYYLPGDLIDNRYKVNEVKRGAMGIIYLCMDAKTTRPIALKTFQDYFLKSSDSRQRFFEEALLWIELGKHPCIVQAYGLRLLEEKPYLLVERIQSSNPRGVTLKDMIYTQALQLEFTLQTAIYICNAMNHAVQQFPKFVHGDLKPENILLGDDHIVKLTDFGIATHLHHVEISASTLSPYELATRMEGTPAFASPEQCRLQVMDTRSDIYSFGCILYQMVTKQIPFKRVEVAEYIHAHLYHKPKPPEVLQPDVPQSLSGLILTCLEKDPYHRYQSFMELQYDLRDIYQQRFGKKAASLHHTDELSYEERIERAWSFALVGRFEQAENEFVSTYKIYGEQPDIHEHLARFYYAKNDVTKAIHFVEQALASNSNDVGLMELKAEICVDLKEWKEAEQVLKRIITIQPQRKDSYLKLSLVYKNRGKEKQQEALIHTAVEACHYDPEIVNELLDLYFKQKKYSQMKILSLKTLELYPNHPEILLRLSHVYAVNREHRRALETLSQAVQTQFTSFSLWRKAGEIFLQLGEYTQAYDAFNNALLYDEGNHAFYFTMAEMSLHLRRYDDAWRLADRAESLGADVNSLRDKIKKNRFLK